MKFSSSLFLLFGTAMAEKQLRGLILEEPCLESTQNITFHSSCTGTSVMQDLEVTLAGICMEHTASEEAMMLTGQVTVRAARQALQQDCVSKRQACLTSVDDITYNTACTGSSVIEDVATALADTCQHDARAEAPVLTGVDTVQLAIKELRSDCEGKRDACLDSLDNVTYNSACTGTSVIEDVATALLGTSCQHGARAEAPVLTGTATVQLAIKELQSDCQEKREACLDSLDNIAYNSACTGSSVIADVATALAGTTCQHGARDEAPILTGTATVQLAITALRSDCQGKREACLDSLYNITYNSACTGSSVIADVATALAGTTCQHGAIAEAPVLTGADSLSEAKNLLRSDCASKRTTCIADLYNDVDFPSCSNSVVVSSIDAKLKEIGCSHGLQAELLLQTGMETLAAAKADVAAQCISTLSPCLGINIDDVSMEGVVCSNAGVVTEVRDLLAATDCTHSDQREMMLLTDMPTFGAARSAFVEKCELQRQPCIEKIYDLDYDNCSQTAVGSTINAKLTELECPHNFNMEAMLQTGNETARIAKKELALKCMDTLTPCLTMGEIDFYPTNCNGNAIKNQISATLATLAAEGTCTHDMMHEIQLLTDKSTTAGATASLVEQCEEARVPCITSFTSVNVTSCDIMPVINAIKAQFPEACPHNLNKEIMLLTNTETRDASHIKIQSLCNTAWDGVEKSTFQNVDSEFDSDFMSEYVKGSGHLNTNTGNFQGDSNPGHATTPRMTEIGENIAEFRGGMATTTVLESVDTLDQCEYQSMICCFGRDRQSNDNNGDCNDGEGDECVNKGPGDNSNLCYVEEPVFTIFDQAAEGSVHCHGLAWDEDENDATVRFRYNNFFFVTLFDHMYQRGYVQDMLDEEEDTTYSDALPMCGCIENMPKVTRADCTQVDVDQTWQINLDSQYLLSIASVGTPTVNFNACQGNDPSDNGGQGNDLASHVNRLTRQKRMSEETRDFIYSRLVGYLAPGDNDNDAACAAAVEDYKLDGNDVA